MYVDLDLPVRVRYDNLTPDIQVRWSTESRVSRVELLCDVVASNASKGIRQEGKQGPGIVLNLVPVLSLPVRSTAANGRSWQRSW